MELVGTLWITNAFENETQLMELLFEKNTKTPFSSEHS